MKISVFGEPAFLLQFERALSPPLGARGEESGLYSKNSIPNKSSFLKILAVGTDAFKSVL